MEHMKDLLVDHCNPILRARYFGVIFDKVPSLADIECGATEIEKLPWGNELFQLAHSKDISLVHLCKPSWHQIVPSLRLMQSKLIDLGFEYYNGKIVINEIETEGSKYHAT